jgi:hypothetical protein
MYQTSYSSFVPSDFIIFFADLNKHIPEHREEVRGVDMTLFHISAWKLTGVMLKFAILTCRKIYYTRGLGILLCSQVP